jgi:hypothetical protein
MTLAHEEPERNIMSILDTPTAAHNPTVESAEPRNDSHKQPRSWAAILSLVASVAGIGYALFIWFAVPAVFSPVVIPALGLIGVALAIVALINTEKNPELKGRDLAFGGLVLGAFGFFSVTSYPIFAIAALVMVLGALTPPVKKILTR